MTNAIHIFSSAPYLAKHNLPITIDKFDVYNTILSALAWRKYNGKITLVTDEIGAELWNNIGICEIWNDIQVTLANDLEGISPTMFWAGGKLLALRDFSAPCVMLDTDFIVWEQLELGNKLVCAHREDLQPHIYPKKEHFQLENYLFLKDLDWSINAANTAFLYLPDEGFKQFYTNQAISFMKSARQSKDFLCYMVFAEQRLLPMLAKLYGIELDTLLDKDQLFFPQNKFTHLWGAKQAMRDNPQLNVEFCTNCINKIKNNFSEFAHLINKVEKYFNNTNY